MTILPANCPETDADAPGGCLLQGCLLWGCLLRGGVSAPGGVCSRGVCLFPGGCLLPGRSARGGGIPACTEADTPPVNRITDRCKNITLATSPLRPINIHHSFTPNILNCEENQWRIQDFPDGGANF